MLCFPSFLHSNEIDTDLSMLTLVVSPPLQVKFGSCRDEAPVGARVEWVETPSEDGVQIPS
jgi:hypothetical protein